MGDEGLFAGELHQHLAGGGACQQRGDDLEIQRLDARAEAAADERLDHADARGIHLQALRQHEVQVIADLRHGLHRETVGGRIVFGERRMRLDLRMIDLGAAEALLAHQIGGSKTLADVAELIVNVAFDVAGLVVVQQDGVRHTGRVRCVISGQFLDLELDQSERPFGRLGVDRGHRRHGLAAIAHAAARHRIFVHGDRQHAVGVRAIVAGDDGDDAVERARLGDVEPEYVGVAHRTAEDASGQRVGMVEIRRVAGLAGNFFNAVDEWNARPFCRARLIGSRRHDADSAAACTDSMIFT